MIAVAFALLLWGAPQDPPPNDPGATAFAAGRFDAAFTAYEAMLDDQDAARADVAFNLGVCAYRLGQDPQAALWFRRAARHAPRDPAIRFNLALTEARLGVDNTPTSPLAMARAAAAAVTPGELLLLTASLQGVGLVGLVLWRRRRLLRLVAAFALALGLTAATPLVLRALFGGTPEGVVLAPELALQPTPDATAPASAHLSGGELVRVREQTEAWLRVEHARGAGWVPRGKVGLVE